MSSEVFSFRALLYFRFSVNFLKFCSFGNFQGGVVYGSCIFRWGWSVTAEIFKVRISFCLSFSINFLKLSEI